MRSTIHTLENLLLALYENAAQTPHRQALRPKVLRSFSQVFIGPLSVLRLRPLGPAARLRRSSRCLGPRAAFRDAAASRPRASCLSTRPGTTLTTAPAARPADRRPI